MTTGTDAAATIGKSIQDKVLVLVHDTDEIRGREHVGSLGEAFTEAGLDLVIGTTLGESGLCTDLPEPAELRALVVMGSDSAAYDDELPWLASELSYVRAAIEAGTPVLGVCFGGQLLARALGGSVAPAPAPEIGYVLFETSDDELPAGPWMELHYDVLTPPVEATVLARNAVGVQAFRYGPHLGVQFHPEMTSRVWEAWWAVRREHRQDDFDPALDLDAVGAEIAAHEDSSRVQCKALVSTFLARSRKGAKVGR